MGVGGLPQVRSGALVPASSPYPIVMNVATRFLQLGPPGPAVVRYPPLDGPTRPAAGGPPSAADPARPRATGLTVTLGTLAGVLDGKAT